MKIYNSCAGKKQICYFYASIIDSSNLNTFKITGWATSFLENAPEYFFHQVAVENFVTNTENGCCIALEHRK